MQFELRACEKCRSSCRGTNLLISPQLIDVVPITTHKCTLITFIESQVQQLAKLARSRARFKCYKSSVWNQTTKHYKNQVKCLLYNVPDKKVLCHIFDPIMYYADVRSTCFFPSLLCKIFVCKIFVYVKYCFKR